MEALKNNSQAIVRALTVAVAVILQAITMVLVGRYLHEYASWAYVLLEIISFLLVFGLINDQESYRQFWCVIVLVFPVTGLFLYYMWGRRRRNSKTHIMIRDTEAKMRGMHRISRKSWKNCRSFILTKSRLRDLWRAKGLICIVIPA